MSCGPVRDEWLRPGGLTNTGNRAYKSRESSVPRPLLGQETSGRDECLEGTQMNEDFVRIRGRGARIG